MKQDEKHVLPRAFLLAYLFARYMSHDTQVLHPISIALVISLSSPANNLTTEEGVAMALWTHLAQTLRLGSLTTALVPDPTSIVAECRHSGLKSYGRCTILILERLRDAVGHR